MEFDLKTLTAGGAAIVSLISLLVSLRAKRMAESRETRRALLENSLNQIGEYLYSIVALSQSMMKTKSNQRFDERRQEAEDASRIMDQLRRQLRYSLWGLDEGFRTLQWLPVYIAHQKHNRNGEMANKLLKRGTKLRKAIDRGLMRSFISGCRPKLRHCLCTKYHAWKLRRIFMNGAPGLKNEPT